MSNRLRYLGQQEHRYPSVGECLTAFLIVFSVPALCWAIYLTTGHAVRF